MSKKFQDFSEDEIITAVNQIPIYIATWMREVGIRKLSEIDEENDIYDAVKKVIMDAWERAKEMHGDSEE